MSPLGKSVQRKQTKIKLGLSIWKLFSAILLANKNLLVSTERSSLVLYWSICSLMQDFSPLSFLSPTSTIFSTCAMLYVQKKTLLAQALRKHKYFFPSSFKRIESGHFLPQFRHPDTLLNGTVHMFSRKRLNGNKCEVFKSCWCQVTKSP